MLLGDIFIAAIALIVGAVLGIKLYPWYQSLAASHAVKTAEAVIAKAEADAKALEAARKVVAAAKPVLPTPPPNPAPPAA
jgi:hypothetical protein